MFKRFSLILFMLILAFALVGPASALGDGPNPTPTPESGGMGGVVLPNGQQPAGSPAFLAGDLTYHGGPVMHTNKTYAIYWAPAGYNFVTSTYRTLINRFFFDVAAASGLSSNVYYSDTQYYSNPGAVHILYKSTFGGSYNDTHTFPANGCALYSGVTKCLSDGQLRAEINRVIALNRWVANINTEFFIFTPYLVGSCFGSSCAYSAYCAYHSYTGSVIYANQPYANTPQCSITWAGVSSSPNGLAADSTINVVSHEHNEAITDPHLNAWYYLTLSGENGDKCAWGFGTIVSNHNQLIHGHYYLLQREWSNHSHTCRLTGL